MPSPAELKSLVAHYADTVNSREPDAIAARFAEDAVQADPAYQPARHGRSAIATFFVDGVVASDDWEFTATDVHSCGHQVAFHFAITIQMPGSAMTINGIEVMSVDDNGLIASAHAYWDDEDVSFG